MKKHDALNNQFKDWLCFFALVITAFFLAYAQDIILWAIVLFDLY